MAESTLTTGQGMDESATHWKDPRTGITWTMDPGTGQYFTRDPWTGVTWWYSDSNLYGTTQRPGAVPNPEPTPSVLPPEPPPPRPARTDVFRRQNTPLRAVFCKDAPRRCKGAPRVYDRVLADNRRLTVYDLLFGPVGSITNITIDGLTLAQLGLTEGVDYNLYLGTGSSAADAIMGAHDGQWATIPHRADVAKLIVRFKRPAAAGPPAVDVTQIEFDVDEGMLIPDPRVDPTLVGRYATSNPALIQAYLDVDARFGGAIGAEYIDWDAVATAADVCDADLGGGRKRYTLNIELDETMDLEELRDRVRVQWAGSYVWNNGRWMWWCDQPQDPSGIVYSHTGTAANIIAAGPIDYKGSSQIPTRVTVKWYDADGEVHEATSDHPDLASGGVDFVEWIYDCRGIGNHDHGMRIAKYVRKRRSIDRSAPARVFASGLRVLPGTVVTVTSDELDWLEVDVWVVGCAPIVGSSSWQHVWEPYSADVFDDDLETVDTYTRPEGPSPYTPPSPPADLALEEVGGGLRVSFTPAVDEPFYRFTRVLVDRTENGVTTSWVLGEVVAGPVTITPLEVTAGYVVRAVTVNVMGLESEEVDATFNAALPPPPGVIESSGVITVGPSAARVVEVVETWGHSGANPWNSALLHDGVLDDGAGVGAQLDTQGEYVQLDFAAPTALREIFVYTSTGGGTSPLSLQYHDGSEWQTVGKLLVYGALTNEDGDPLVLQVPAGVGARAAWRLTMINAGNSGEIYEIVPCSFVEYAEVYGYKITTRTTEYQGTEEVTAIVLKADLGSTSWGWGEIGYDRYSTYPDGVRTGHVIGGNHKLRVETIGLNGAVSKYREIARSIFSLAVPANGFTLDVSAGGSFGDVAVGEGRTKLLNVVGDPSSDVTLTGVVTDDALAADLLIIRNVTSSAKRVLIAEDDAGSAEENRFGEADTIAAGESAAYVFDGNNAGWYRANSPRGGGDGMPSTKDVNFGNATATFAASALPEGANFDETASPFSDTNWTTVLSVTGKGALEFLSVGSVYNGATAGRRQVKLRITVDGSVLPSWNDVTVGLAQNGPTGTPLGKAVIGQVLGIWNGTNYILHPVMAVDGIPFSATLLVEVKRGNSTSENRYVAWQFKEFN